MWYHRDRERRPRQLVYFPARRQKADEQARNIVLRRGASYSLRSIAARKILQACKWRSGALAHRKPGQAPSLGYAIKRRPASSRAHDGDVMLVRCDRLTREDLDWWSILERQDEAVSRMSGFEQREAGALETIRDFVATRSGVYAGVSWGKDSMVVAGILAIHAVAVPLVWVRVEPVANPHCVLVRDAFLKRFPAVDYHEIVEQCERDSSGRRRSSGVLDKGFRRAATRFGRCHISGVRGQESGDRKRRMLVHGTDSKYTCAPVGWWKTDHVFAFLKKHDLPVHPAYAMTAGGRWPREHIRVATIGGSRGAGRGRSVWESMYYRRELELAHGSKGHIDGRV